METKILQAATVNAGLLDNRKLTKAEWIENFASGTLRHSANLGLRYNSLYIEERTCFEFGWEFRCVPTSRVLFNDLLAEGDCSAITETVWHARRAIAMRRFTEDNFQVKYIHFTDHSEGHLEGAGLVLAETSAKWLPEGHLVFAFVSNYQKGHGWYEAKNPL